MVGGAYDAKCARPAPSRARARPSTPRALERGRGRAAGLSRSKRAPGVLVSFAGGVCLPRPRGRCGGTWRVGRLQAPESPDGTPRRWRRGLPAALSGNATGGRDPGRMRARSPPAAGSGIAEEVMPEVLDRIDDRELALVDDTVVGPFSLDALRVSLGVLRGLEGIDIRQFPPRLPAEIEKRPEFEGIRIEIYPHNAARRLFHQERWTFWTAVLEPQGASTATYRGVSIPYADLGHSCASLPYSLAA